MDVPTLIVAIIVLQGCCAVGLLLLSRGAPELSDLRWFASFYAVSTLAFKTIALAGTPPSPNAILLARTLMLLGAVLLTQGVAAYVVASARTLAWGGGFLLGFALIEAGCLKLDSMHGQIGALAVFCLAFAAQIGVAAWVLQSHTDGGERTACLATAAVLAGIAGLNFLWLARVWIHHIAPYLRVSDLQRFAGLALYLCLNLGAAFGLLWMAIARQRRLLEIQARTDVLTGVLNRSALEAAALQLGAACRKRGAPLGVLAIDLDRFKGLNDNFGHAGGDAVLAAVAGWLSEGLGTSDLVGRIGGEEFVAVLPHRDPPAALAIAERLRQRLEAGVVNYEGQRLAVTASFGLAMLGPREEWREVLRRADLLLYAAKLAGRNCIRAEVDAASAAAPPVANLAAAGSPTEVVP